MEISWQGGLLLGFIIVLLVLMIIFPPKPGNRRIP